MILEVRRSTVWVTESINDASRDDSILHRLVDFCFQIFRTTEIISNDIRCIEKVLAQSVSAVSTNNKVIGTPFAFA